jgi:hypothetical protein
VKTAALLEVGPGRRGCVDADLVGGEADDVAIAEAVDRVYCGQQQVEKECCAPNEEGATVEAAHDRVHRYVRCREVCDSFPRLIDRVNGRLTVIHQLCPTSQVTVLIS